MIARRRTERRHCSVDGCGRDAYCRGLCGSDYRRWLLLSSQERRAVLRKPDPPKWEFEGDSEALAARCSATVEGKENGD